MAGDGAPEDLVPVAEAARQVGVSSVALYYWIRRGRLQAHPGRHGQRVSLAAVRAVAEATVHQPRPPAGPRELPGDDDAEYVLPSVAARAVGVSPYRVHYWKRTGKVASRMGRYGRLVRLIDVQAVAAQHASTPQQRAETADDTSSP